MALTKISRGLLSTGISDSSDATAITIDSSENVLVGSGTSNGISGSTTGLQVAGAGFAGMISATRHDNNAYSSALMLGKSRNTTVGSNTIVQSGDEIGAIGFFADDGTNLDSQVAYIRALVDGTPGENDTPGRLTFSTTADGSAAATEKMRLDSSGNLGIGTTSPSSKLHVYGGAILVDNGSSAGTIYFHDTTNYINLSSDALQFANNGAERVRIDSSGNVGIGTTSPDNTLHVDASGGGTIKLTRESVSTANFLRLECDGANGSIVSKQTTIFNNGDAERMRIDSDGKVTVDPAGNFADDNAGVLELRASAATGGWAISARSLVTTSSGTWFIGKQSNGTNVFSLVSDSDSIDLTFLSDERMKMNITDSADVLDKVKQITVKDFDWRTELNGDTKDNTRETKKYGFIAQNFQSIGLGQYVKELMPTDESDDTLGMDYGNITPILVKAIQEQQTQIEALQSEINTLKGGD
jgi:hypothetical protein